MIGVYFSGTGNTKHCVEKFMRAYGPAEDISNTLRTYCRPFFSVSSAPWYFSATALMLESPVPTGGRRAYGPAEDIISIEAENAIREISKHPEIIIGYPVQFSNIPKILQNFVADK